MKNSIEIFKMNGKRKIYSIIISKGTDDVNGIVSFQPQEYNEENPQVKIIISGLFFSEHLKTGCKDCNAFYNDFGTNKSWYIKFDDKAFPLDLKEFNGRKFDKNWLTETHGYYLNGTTFKFKLLSWK
jgi:hypothetical protein